MGESVTARTKDGHQMGLMFKARWDWHMAKTAGWTYADDFPYRCFFCSPSEIVWGMRSMTHHIQLRHKVADLQSVLGDNAQL